MENLHRALGKLKVGHGAPGLALLAVRVHADDANEKTNHTEQMRGALGAVDEGLRQLERLLISIDHQHLIRRRVDVLPNRQPTQGDMLRATRDTGTEIPELLPGIGQHELHEGLRQFRLWRATHHGHGINADRRAAHGGHEAHT